ncbi:MAG: transporter substrate-binding domain-containing protein [Alphaproteobacteria bacterium]|nr:transporter substrate-binding domain-containing protein [Alphaproteobacteria bacterium]
MFLVVLGLCVLSIPVFAADKQYSSAYDRVMDTGVLRCGYFVWAPHFVIDPLSGQKSGMIYDVIERLGKVLNLKVEWTLEYSFGTQIESLKTGKIDALCADGNWTRGTLPYLDYSVPYVFLAGYAYGLKDNPKIKGFDSLNSPDIRFTNIDGDGSAEYIDLYFPKAKRLSMPATTDSHMLLQNILTGKADAMLNDPLSVDDFPLDMKSRLRVIGGDQPLGVAGAFVSVQKGEDKLLKMLNQGIELMNDTGMIDQILDHYDPSGKKLLRPQKRYR